VSGARWEHEQVTGGNFNLSAAITAEHKDR
jgi:hypothetical protein